MCRRSGSDNKARSQRALRGLPSPLSSMIVGAHAAMPHMASRKRSKVSTTSGVGEIQGSLMAVMVIHADVHAAWPAHGAAEARSFDEVEGFASPPGSGTARPAAFEGRSSSPMSSRGAPESSGHIADTGAGPVTPSHHTAAGVEDDDARGVVDAPLPWAPQPRAASRARVL